ncbi:hypothetical protein DF268_08645 [Streptomyces sp. V2]|uniref:hypothetical protein n=1 Tax=Streptomyces sp. V2 TaxID=1424099 RepID=UPI000D66A812|nr:hypothetical protein [Streptomyces sp. V2]PWG13924.1 hypothetical protein DF268_08645 [Streptomyces sp. V2]
MSAVSGSGGSTGISLAGRWECGACGASGDGWYDEDDGLVLHDEHGQPFDAEDHDCGDDS